MDLSLVAYTLSKVLITAVFCYRPQTFAEESCGHIGNSDETQLRAIQGNGDDFYLDMNNTACCTGNITSWKVCYYGPNNSNMKLYTVFYAVYRLDGTQNYYSRVSNQTFTITLQGQKRQQSEYAEIVDNGFNCYSNEPLDTPFAVEQRDIIGACVVDPTGSGMLHRLEVVSDAEGEPDVLYRSNNQNNNYKEACRMNMTLPATIKFDSTQFLSVPRRLHLTANITCEAPSADETTEPSPVSSGMTPMEMNTTQGTTVTYTEIIGNSPVREQEDQALREIRNSGRLNQVWDLSGQNDLHTLHFYTVTKAGVLTRTHSDTKIQNESHLSALTHLEESTMEAVQEHEVNLTAPIYLLSATVNSLNRLGNRPVTAAISEQFLRASGSLLEIAQTESRRTRFKSLNPPLGIAGSTLLRVIDRFALNNYNISQTITNLSESIVFHVEEVSLKFNDTVERISPIEGEIAELNIPIEVLESAERGASVRMASFLFRNMSGLLPESLNDEAQNDTNQEDHVLRLASPVISASFQCDNCTTSNLSTPVEVIFTHLSYDKALLENDINGTTTCVFWEFEDDQHQGGIFYAGQWSTEGCETNFTSNSTVCRCNHLTHFAILLSARPLDLSSEQTLALQITGYIGVSVSLVAMAATIFVFVFLKPLHTMRNYIHIQLCVTLGIAQIIFVAGVEPRLGERSGVPIGCRSVAVLLHYWYLVSFMWMLMEGVVLYIVLVRVFIKFHGRYIAAFTIASYGLPLLYMGALTLPLGFVRTSIYRQYHSYDYGYEQACYLNPDTSFVWSLIAPVILIFLANVGFFIMAIVIMYRHQKRQNIDDKKHKVKHWIKASISLTVVMGITWIIGFLVIEVEELFSLAYIFTIFVAFQGVFIFVIFVLLSKQVRENYAKWWKAKVAESDFLSKHFGDKILTSGTGLSAQNNNIPLPAARGKINGDSGISNKVYESSIGEQKQAMESYCDLKSESYFVNENVRE